MEKIQFVDRINLLLVLVFSWDLLPNKVLWSDSCLAHLGLLGGLDDDAVGGVVELPGNYT